MTMRKLVRLSCIAAIVGVCSQAGATEIQMPIDFVGEWCSPSTFEGKTKYTLPSWTDEGKCTDILSIEKWGFTFSEREGGRTCLPTTFEPRRIPPRPGPRTRRRSTLAASRMVFSLQNQSHLRYLNFNATRAALRLALHSTGLLWSRGPLANNYLGIRFLSFSFG